VPATVRRPDRRHRTGVSVKAEIRSESQRQAGRDRDVVPRLRIAAVERLELRHVVARLEAEAEASKPELAAEGAVAGEIGFRVDVEVPVVVRARACAEANVRREVERT